MWYFTWVLGLGLACAFAILNALWYELLVADAGGEISSEHTEQERRPR